MKKFLYLLAALCIAVCLSASCSKEAPVRVYSIQRDQIVRDGCPDSENQVAVFASRLLQVDMQADESKIITCVDQLLNRCHPCHFSTTIYLYKGDQVVYKWQVSPHQN